MKLDTQIFKVKFQFDYWDTILTQEIEVKKGKNKTIEFEKWIKKHTTEFGVNAGTKFKILTYSFVGLC